MSRRRYISTEISVDKQVNRMGMEYGDAPVLLYTWMIPHADDQGRLPGDPFELLNLVWPGRRDKTEEDVVRCLTAMDQYGLIRWDRTAEAVIFPARNFYKYQTYIKPSNRRHADEESPNARPAYHPDDQRKTAQNSEDQRTSAENGDDQRKTAQISASPSPSPSPSLTPPKDKAKARAVRARGREARSADDPAQDLPTASPRSTPLPSPMPFRASQSDGETIPRASGMNPLADDPKSLSGLLRAYHDQYPGSDQATDGRRIGRWIRDYGADQVAWAFDELWAQRAQGKSVQKPLAYVQSVLQGAVARDPPRTRIEAHNQAVLQAFLADTDDEEEGQPYDPAARSTNPRDAGQRVPSRATDPEPSETLASDARRSAHGPGGRGDGTPYSTE